RRPPDHAGRRAQGAHPHGRERSGHERAARHVRGKLIIASAVLALAAALASACDINDTQHYQNTIGPTIRVIGTNIDPVTAEIPSDDVIQISFDRYLLPST